MRASHSPIDTLLHALHEAGMPHGREDSFKLSHGRLLSERTMLGVRTRHIGVERALQIATQFGLPSSATAALRAHWPQADVVLFGLEHGPDETVFKLYLEFWESVRREVLRTGSSQPLLLDLGFKWRASGEPQLRVARYTCHPLLSRADSLGRIHALYAGAHGASAYRWVVELVERCAQRRPGAAFVYLEAEEDASPRRSFDINLYKAELPMARACDWLDRLGRHYAIDAGAMRSLQQRIGEHPLGHISGGIDRRGEDFLTIYHEVEPLDA
jgi:hypothetical protein